MTISPCIMHWTHKPLLLLLLVYLGAQAALGSEIINGRKAAKNELLFMASVQNNGQHKCGGFLINENFVVTAAHCGVEKNDKLSVVLGTHNLKKVDEKVMRYNVHQCQHPSYKNIGSGNDIMLLRLTRKAKLSKSLKAIKLPSKGKSIKANTKCVVAGWGRNETSGTVVDDLQVVDVSIIDQKLCRQEWLDVPRRKLPDTVICAGGYETDKGACQGDSGGPLVCNGMAVGVVSFNYKKNCDYPNVPNVYTDVAQFIPWIGNITKKMEC